ncbi:MULTISPECIES: 3'-5' exonuclease [Amycolatopsis]|uniref:DNA polymerase-3 subunit epsilon n=2 Tax=Amycolatopsis TaxID=1813 RepID=A0A1I4DD63_9PSEU|nr:3'-5' exonuclease [Amycolatopsis sacchari]SFK90953.1 DNA polymerase-3 subunit epsilon [Amycolatopsis sacchari]
MPEVVDVLELTRAGGYDATGLEFTAIGCRTTALRSGQLVELAAVRTRADGSTIGELSTLLNQESAPTLPEVLGYFTELLQGAVLVAHNLAFVARFLGPELDRYGIRVPAVDTLTTAKNTVRLPNYRLGTVARSLGITDTRRDTALDDARTGARVVTALVGVHGLRLTAWPRFGPLPQLVKSRPLAPRRAEPAAPAQGWTAELPDRMPLTVPVDSPDPALEEAYLEVLGNAVAARQLTSAPPTGFGEDELRRIHTGFVHGMRTVAEADGILTVEEVADLKAVATTLGVPGVVADVRPTERADRPTRVLVLGRGADADELRAAVLTRGFQLAKNLTASVTHLVVCPDIAPTEPRLARAAEQGVTVLDAATARRQLATPAPEAAPAPPPVTRLAPALAPAVTPARPQGTNAAQWGGRVITALGLVLVFVAAIAEFGGAPFAAGLVAFVLGAGIALGGWYLGERWSVRSW